PPKSAVFYFPPPCRQSCRRASLVGYQRIWRRRRVRKAGEGKTNMEFSLSSFNTSVNLRCFSSSVNDRFFTGGQCKPPLNLLLHRSSTGSSSSVAYSRRRSQNSAITSSSKGKKQLQKSSPPGDDIDEDAFDALFEDDDSSELDEDDYGEIGEEELERLQHELEEAFGVDGDDDGDSDEEMISSDNDSSEDRPLKLKNWQIRRLAVALKKGRRKISVKNLAGDLCLERGVVLELLRNPPPSLVMMSAALPDEPEPVLLPPVRQMKLIEAEIAETAPAEEESSSKDESKVKLPVHVMFQKWNAQKRLKKVHAQTLERVYRRTKRPTNTMVSSIVHVTNLPRKRVVQWFEDKRTEEGVPENRRPYRRSITETASSS
ncbi:Protein OVEREXPRESSOR OF CATIONIC PEROXIDASE 3, partial [Linum grandiflorum]